jgi:TolB protein
MRVRFAYIFVYINMRYTDLQKISVVAVSAVVISAILILHPWTWRTASSSANVYVSSDYKVRFEYPHGWQPVEGTEGHRIQGDDGFLEVGAAGDDISISSLTGPAGPTAVLPYGSNPTVEDVEAGGERGGLVMPSQDQGSAMQNQAALVVSYPEPIELNGNMYSYFILWADKEHIRDMADTLEFTN